MGNEDTRTGRILDRREVLGLLGGVAAMAGGLRPRSASAQGLPSCVVTPEQTEGPFFVDTRLNRSDIRSDPVDKSVREGVPLALVLHVSSVGPSGCNPLPGAMVDVWHCDSAGAYSDSERRSAGKKFLRGYQLADTSGIARFTTIYPGWYPGRAVHIHFKVRIIAGSGFGNEFTSQVYFDEAITDRVHARAPYVSHGRRTQRNSEDALFRRNGKQLMLALGETASGYIGEFHVGMKL